MKKEFIKKIILVSLSVFMVGTLAACGSKQYSKSESGVLNDVYVEKEAFTGLSNSYFADESMPMATPAPQRSSVAAAEGSSDYSKSGYSDNTAGDMAPIERKVIKTANLNVQTLEFENYIKNLKDSISQHGGYIESSNISDVGYNRWGELDYTSGRNAYFSIRIPENKLDSFLDMVGNMGNITSKTYNEQDISLTYVDTESRIKTLTQERDTLLKLMQDANYIDEVISLEARLSEVNYQLETYQSRLRGFDNQVNYSTVWINITEVNKITPVTPVQITWGQRIVDGFKGGVERIVDGFQDFVVWFVSNLFGIIIWVAIIVGAVFFVRSKIRKNRNKKAQKEAEKKSSREQSSREQQ